MQHYDVGDFHHTYAECARKHYGMGVGLFTPTPRTA